MRIVSCLAIAVAALTSIACGGPAPSGGNEFVSEGALERLEGMDDDVNTGAPFRLVPVTVDTTDPGCTVDGVRFGRCTLTRTPAADVRGQSLDVCDLETDSGGTYSWECDDASSEAAAAVERFRERAPHCPSGG